jgi:hypothetical protein
MLGLVAPDVVGLVVEYWLEPVAVLVDGDVVIDPAVGVVVIAPAVPAPPVEPPGAPAAPPVAPPAAPPAPLLACAIAKLIGAASNAAANNNDRGFKIMSTFLSNSRRKSARLKCFH